VVRLGVVLGCPWVIVGVDSPVEWACDLSFRPSGTSIASEREKSQIVRVASGVGQGV